MADPRQRLLRPTCTDIPPGNGFATICWYLILATLVLALASLLRFDSQDRLFVPVLEVQLPMTCVSRQFFGWDCPGCGLTRGFVALVHGQWKRAWLFNPGTYLALFLVVTTDTL
jgi:hypothetical protein